MNTRQRITHRSNEETGVLAVVSARYIDGVFSSVEVRVYDTDADEVVGTKPFPTTKQEEAIAYAEQCTA